MPERLSSEGTRGGENRPEHGEEERREWKPLQVLSESGGDERDGEPRVVTTGGGGVTGTVTVALFGEPFLFISLTIQQSVLNTVVLLKYLGRSNALYDKTMYLAWRRTIIYTKAQADNLLPFLATIHHLTSSNIWHTRSTKDIVDQSTFLFEIMPLT